MKNPITVVCVLAILGSTVKAQSVNINTTVSPQINQLCPAFSFDTLLNYKNEKLSLADLKGKFVIIDFWGTFCLPCIAAFPKLENWQKQFGDSLQILLVATDGYQKAKQFYETRKKANKCARQQKDASYPPWCRFEIILRRIFKYLFVLYHVSEDI